MDDNEDRRVTDLPDAHFPSFAVVVAIVDCGEGETVEYAFGVLEADAVLGNVRAVLFLVPLKLQRTILL